MAVAFDLDGLVRRVRGARIGVACTPAGWIPGRGHIADILRRETGVAACLALEHGLRGELQDGVRVESYRDPRLGCPVFSGYGHTHGCPPAFLDAVDVVVFHAQDVSHRAYTYHQALAAILGAAAAAGKAVIVLDRPTPLGHLPCAGPLHAQFFPEPLPVVLPFTLGELGLWLRQRRGIDVDLTVVPARGWRRALPWDAAGLPWVPPSLNIPTLHSAYAYAAAGILQQTTLSEGRGTCKPFEYFGAPCVEASALAESLNARGLPGVAFREAHFTPAFNKFAGEPCAGVHLMLTDLRAFDPLRTLWAVLQEAIRLHPDALHLQPAFGTWLDGGEWTPARIAALDTDAWLATHTGAAASFAAQIEALDLYRA